MADLRISAELSLPDNAITQTFSVLARKGAGKTYLAMVMAEEMIKASLPVVILDPLGATWGLRVSADGTGPGLPVTILGGDHGDIPLEPTAGKVVADVIVDHPGAFILDMSGFESNAAQDRFVTDFAERIYRAKATKRQPLHLIIDEADSFGPQKPMPGQQRMLGAFEAIVRRGRIRGIGVTLVTQRPAVLNKNLLTQTECLVTLQMTAPQDREAIDDWVRGNGTREERDELLASLASLDRGDAWFWSPSWLRVFKRIHVRLRETWDSSKTPEPGDETVEPISMADVDLDALRERMAETIERAKVDDPKELQKTIADLKRQLVQKTHEQPEPVAPEIKTVEVPVLSEETIAKLNEITDQWRSTAMRIIDAADEVKSALVSYRPAQETRKTDLPNMPRNIPKAIPERPPRNLQTTPSSSPVATDIKISGPQQRILDALAELEAVGLTDVDRSNVAVYADASPRSSAFGNNLGSLRTAQLIEYPSGGRVCLTDAGRDLANAAVLPRTLDELHMEWKRHLSRPQVAILGELLATYPDPIPRDDLANFAGASATSSAYGNNLGHLRSLGLISYPQRGMVAATDLLFPEGLR